jgi:hypothetical protein
MDENIQDTVTAVHDYWNSHTLGFQYVTDPNIQLDHRNSLPTSVRG